MTPKEGQRVRWDGYPGPSHLATDEGKVLSSTDRYCQVMWTTGSQTGRVEPVPTEFLQPLGRGRSQISASLDDSLDVPEESMGRTSVRQIVAEEGIRGLMQHAANGGALWSLGSLSEDVVDFAQRQAAENPEVAEVASHLDVDDRPAFIAAVTAAVLVEAAKGDSDG